MSESSCSGRLGGSVTQPEGDKSGRVREECCALKKKAVRKNLEFPVAFEPTLKGIMAAASGLSCGSRKKGFGQKQISPSGYSLGPKIPLQITPKLFTTHTHRAAHSKAKVLCRVPFRPNPNNL